MGDGAHNLYNAMISMSWPEDLSGGDHLSNFWELYAEKPLLNMISHGKNKLLLVRVRH